ncbi:MAG TPA: FeoB-associated Cys-rich membrane protein [Lachnospiraceae bacterium]|nr:FeoB-associated Cys-rich membrane protein [Lachnospiraceae bacterium]
MLEIILLIILALWFYLAVKKLYKDRKNGRCSGCSSANCCTNCGHGKQHEEDNKREP